MPQLAVALTAAAAWHSLTWLCELDVFAMPSLHAKRGCVTAASRRCAKDDRGRTRSRCGSGRYFDAVAALHLQRLSR
jgi:hypothetical protein